MSSFFGKYENLILCFIKLFCLYYIYYYYHYIYHENVNIIFSYKENSCSGCGKDNHSVFFCGNIHHLGIKEIETWLKSINSPPFVHVIKKDQQG